ncbi:MAG TPA: sigma-70 family RNA polymerase sigma factor [Vicinamibacterales bacterium]|jgi:RNA polymerase sigma-70 factor (ECF subfamily)
MRTRDAVLTGWFEDHRAFLWGLSYRITGSAADADDVVQETFVRAWQHAPAQLDDPRRWLTRVAVNAARDLLRRRKRRRYVGPWLPTPIETSDDAPPSYEPVVEGRTLEGRYDLLESASFAFLVALEALSPTQRAVLLLRDVFDYSAAEVAAALDLSDGNVRIIHHRARRVMEAYERRRSVPTAPNRIRTDQILQKFLQLVRIGDVKGIERMLAADVKAVTDAGGEFTASRRPIVGARPVARFFARLAASRAGRLDVSIRSINEFPAALLEFTSQRGRRPPRLVLSIDVSAAGLISHVRVIASATKLLGLGATTSPSARLAP